MLLYCTLSKNLLRNIACLFIYVLLIVLIHILNLFTLPILVLIIIIIIILMCIINRIFIYHQSYYWRFHV